jgi:hypothetical protein
MPLRARGSGDRGDVGAGQGEGRLKVDPTGGSGLSTGEERKKLKEKERGERVRGLLLGWGPGPRAWPSWAAA